MSVKRDVETGQWVVEFELRKRRIHRRCPRGTTKAEAEALETTIRSAIFAESDLGVIPDVPLAGVVQLWLEESVAGSKSELSRQRHAYALDDAIAGHTLRDVVAVADAYRRDARAAGLSPLTINRRLAVLKAVAKFAFRKRLAPENYSARIPLTDERAFARHVYLSPAEVRKLASKATTFAGKAWIMLPAYTGLRRAELHALTPQRVRRGVIDLGETKNGEPRLVPVATPGVPFLKALPWDRTVDSLDWEFRAARVAAGFPDLRYHDLRHTYASMLVNKDVDLYVVARLLGNDPSYTAPRYAHLRLGTLKRAVRKLG